MSSPKARSCASTNPTACSRPLPLHQALEFTGGLLLPLLGGATITYLEAVNSREMLRALRDTRTTVLLTAPRLLHVLADRVERLGAESTAALAALRRVVSVGAALSDDLIGTYEQFGVAICQGYGLSEAASIVAVNAPNQGRAKSVRAGAAWATSADRRAG